MPSTTWIAIGISAATLIAATITAFSVAAMQRKQMRQIELHRVDPAVPLVPPPHPMTHFFKLWGVPIINISVDLSFLIYEASQTGPVTREQVFSIALFTASLIGQFVIVAILWVTFRIWEMFEKSNNLLGEINKLNREAFDGIWNAIRRQQTLIEVIAKFPLEPKPKDDSSDKS
jgi:hypothetical protein